MRQEHRKELESALKAVIQRSKSEAIAAAKEIAQLKRALGMDPGEAPAAEAPEAEPAAKPVEEAESKIRQWGEELDEGLEKLHEALSASRVSVQVLAKGEETEADSTLHRALGLAEALQKGNKEAFGVS